MNLEEYDYDLPKELIAKVPAEPRDSSRLFVFETKTSKMTFDLFKNVDKYLPENSLLVINNTKVVPARAMLKKSTGGKVEILFLVNEPQADGLVKAISDRKIKVGDDLFFDKDNFVRVAKQEEMFFFFQTKYLTQPLIQLLEKYGHTPIPKYIKGTNLDENNLRQKYQSIFASEPGSVAAPTASFHFTSEVVTKLKNKSIEKTEVTLNVGMGTFSPVTPENLKNNKLHREVFEISEPSAQKISRAKSNGQPIIAVGTTTVRTLESNPQIIRDPKSCVGSTELFIHPPFAFRVVDILITNFHLPQSSLMCLVQAFLRHKGSSKHITELYQTAILEKFRFYSFGDAMLIL